MWEGVWVMVPLDDLVLLQFLVVELWKEEEKLV